MNREMWIVTVNSTICLGDILFILWRAVPRVTWIVHPTEGCPPKLARPFQIPNLIWEPV